MSIQDSFPQAFVSAMNTQLGVADAEEFFVALSQTPPVSVRLNALKKMAVPSGGQPVPWAAAAYYLAERPQFTFDPRLHAGAYYVQEAASMFVEQAWKALPFTPQRVLDLCAAPGGKSTLWRSLMPEGALLVANEPVGQRAMVLAENLSKWGQPDVVVTENYPKQFGQNLEGFFDVVAADVPCSGEGMFRKNAGAVAEWSEENVAMCAERQWQIVSDVWPALREGGCLVYSTCTFNAKENEQNVQRIITQLGAKFIPIQLDPDWGVVQTDTGYHFYPHRTRGEGFFLALLQKTSPQPTGKVKAKPLPAVKSAGWLKTDSDFVYFKSEPEKTVAVRRSLSADVSLLRQRLHVLSAGIDVCETKGRKIIPCHALALSAQLRPDAFPRVELTLTEAISVLQRQSITLPAHVQRGYVIATFEGLPIGFLNNLGSRANNMYPSAWRIRSEMDSSVSALWT